MDKGFKIVFMGTPEFAVHSLKAILNEKIDVAGVVTSVDKPAGRGRQIRQSEVKAFAISKGIKILQPTNLKDPDFQKELKSLDADLFVVVAFRMLPESVWAMPEMGTINLHASLLPNYRGAAPINWAIINGEKETGVTTFFIEKQIDTGEVIFQEKVEIEKEMTAGDLHDKLAIVGSRVLVNTIIAIRDGNVISIPQVRLKTNPSRAPKIFKEDCKINWDDHYQRVYDFIRGLSPYPGSWTTLEGNEKKVVKVIHATKDGEEHSLSPGTIQTDNKHYLKVAAQGGWIFLKEIIPQGKGKMDIKSFLNGNEIESNFSFA